MSITVSVKERDAFKLIQINSRPTIQAMDREKEEKTPGNNPRGKTSGARGVARVGKAEVEGTSEIAAAGESLRFWLAHIKRNVEKAYADEYAEKLKELRGW